MEEKDLIRKLEKISLPEIEIKSHKNRLKLALMEKYLPTKQRGEFFGILRKLAPVSAIAVILFFFISNNLNSPQRNLAKAKEIALKNTEIKDWVAEGAIIKDVQIVDGRAYVLIEPTEVEKEKEAVSNNLKIAGLPSETSKVKEEEFKGALVEVDIKEKKISKIENLTPKVTNLIEVKKEKTKEIADRNLEIQKIITEGAEVLDINVTTPKFKLNRQGSSVQALPETEAEERASIIYKSDGNTWEGKINLTKEEVEEIKFFGELQNDATSEESDR
jgi:hypothetical protein